MSNEPVKVIRPPPRRVVAQRPPAPVDADGALSFADAPPATGWQAPATTAVPPLAAPALTLAEARDRFIGRYLFLLIGALLGGAVKEPQTVAEWVTLARAVKCVLDAQEAGREAMGR